MPIGPQLPPSVEKRKRSVEKRKRSDESDDSDSNDNLGPQLPSGSEDNMTAKRARVLGPSLPGTIIGDKPSPTKQDASNEESSDDDEFGPSLPTEADPGQVKSTSMSSPSTTQSKPAASAATITQSKRDEWMTMAPASGDWSQRVDPTKLKNRKFNTGKSSSNFSSGADAWHETPEQKQARLQREVLGIKDDKSSTPQSATVSVTQDDAGTARRMKDYNKQRGPSLYDAHQKGKKAEKEDDPSARAFDREKDIGGGLQLNSTQRREMMKKSSNFSSRFSSAKYL